MQEPKNLHRVKSQEGEKMKKAIDVLMLDGCTRREAEKHLKAGTRVFDDYADYAANMEADGMEPETETAIKRGKVQDVRMVEGFIIEYVM